MKRTLRALTRRQKIILAGMAIANVAALTLVFLILRSSLAAPAALAVPTPDCASLAAHLLARHNLAGTASIDPGQPHVLRLYLTGLDTAGQPLPQATDMAWDALAAVLGLPRLGCGSYSLVQVDVPLGYHDAAPSDSGPASTSTRLLVSADWIDLRAWGYGELDDGALAQRLQTTLYTQPWK